MISTALCATIIILIYSRLLNNSFKSLSLKFNVVLQVLHQLIFLLVSNHTTIYEHLMRKILNTKNGTKSLSMPSNSYIHLLKAFENFQVTHFQNYKKKFIPAYCVAYLSHPHHSPWPW